LSIPAGPIRPVVVVHQEGVVGLVAVVGMALREDGPVGALAARGGVPWTLALGGGVGAALAAVVWALRWVPALRALETWQRQLVGEWAVTDAVAIAVVSGVAEEALFRAVLQPLVGLWAAAGLFAVLHLGPARQLWVWPLVALAMGLAFGLVFLQFGYPACAAAHVAVNLVGLLRLRRADPAQPG
jgi:membrane protease YdiL (CAAX protease family)